MANIEEALKRAGAESDLQTILGVLEDRNVGFHRQEAAAGPFANMDTAVLAGLNVRMLSVIKRAQQQQQNLETFGAMQADSFASEVTALKEQVKAVEMAKQVLQANVDRDRAIKVAELKAQVQQAQREREQREAAMQQEKDQQEAAMQREKADREKAELQQQNQALLDRQKAQEDLQARLILY